MTLFSSTTGIAPAVKAFAQFTPNTASRRLFIGQQLRFALAAEAFSAQFHGTVAGRDGHGAKLDATAALLAELGSDAEGVVHMTIFTPSDKTDRLGSPDLCANSYAASA